MKCEYCGKNYFPEIIILRDKNFNPNASRNVRGKVHRVCWGCARDLVRKRWYSFGDYWDTIFIDEIEILKVRK